MTTEQINIAIAEACGWIRFFEPDDSGDEGVGKWLWHCGTLNLKVVPDYCHDLNAMHEAEQSLNVELGSDYVILLGMVVGRSRHNEHNFDLVCATSIQRAEAFLCTKGLWKE